MEKLPQSKRASAIRPVDKTFPTWRQSKLRRVLRSMVERKYETSSTLHKIKVLVQWSVTLE